MEIRLNLRGSGPIGEGEGLYSFIFLSVYYERTSLPKITLRLSCLNLSGEGDQWESLRFGQRVGGLYNYPSFNREYPFRQVQLSP